MAAPEVIFTCSGEKLSEVSGFDHITVTFQTDIPCRAFECRATKVGEDWGVGKGELVASFSTTPAGVQRTFEVYDDFLLQGDGQYRLSLFAQGEDGSWNDNHPYIPVGAESYLTADGAVYLCVR